MFFGRRETAEMPGMYKSDEFDIAGFAVGAVERENKIGKKKLKISYSRVRIKWFHSNGFSLIRKIINDKNLLIASPI